MRIVNVTTAVVTYHGQATLVRIDTDEGISGYGEANPDAGAGGVVGMISFLTPLLLGEDPRNVERVWEKLRRKVFAGPQAGVFVIALGGIELALWDLAGKAAGQPVYRLLGCTPTAGGGTTPPARPQGAPTGRSGWSGRGSPPSSSTSTT
jgi:galactonate dehydratase